MKDIAEISGDDPEQVAAFSGIVLGFSAPPGFSRLVSTGDITGLLPNRNGQRIIVQGKKVNRVCVKTGYIEKKISDYNNFIYNYLHDNVSWPEGDWECVIENDLQTFKSYNAPVSIEIRGLTEEYPYGSVQLQFIARQYNKKKILPLSCHFKITTSVVIARNDIPRNKIITINDCEMHKRDISAFAQKPCFSLSEVVGKKASRTIPGGSILTGKMVMVQPDIIKGDNLSLQISRGNVIISVSAVARENGRIGEKIWVKNTATNKLVRVVVTDKNSVILL
ncbi:MAG: flagellar basal body P-ring formation protein FlgA [Chitinispirillaceae bacterium]|nr:flagellar basal body P-ring formation protein FlgA [Chitinispirillaceae bacterium]